MQEHKFSAVKACKLLKLSRTAFYHNHKLIDDSVIKKKLGLLADKYPRYGFGLMFNKLRNQGHQWNHKRVYRVYCDMKLNLRIKPRKRLPDRHPVKLGQPIQNNVCWSVDFMSDALISGRKYRTFNVIDDFNREALGIEVDTSLTGERVTKILDKICLLRGYPKIIRLDNGPEFISKKLALWAKDHKVQLGFIEPGKPSQNAYIERFNRTYREEVLNMYLFKNLKEVRIVTNKWLEDYNHYRPHSSLGNKPPVEYAKNVVNCFAN